MEYADRFSIKDINGVERIKQQGKLLNKAIKNLTSEELKTFKNDIDKESLEKTGEFLEKLDKAKISYISNEAKKLIEYSNALKK